jgi:hypothetical protein
LHQISLEFNFDQVTNLDPCLIVWAKIKQKH